MIAGAIIITLAMTALAIFLIYRAPGGRFLRILQRLLAIVAACVLAVTTGALMVNRHFDFFKQAGDAFEYFSVFVPKGAPTEVVADPIEPSSTPEDSPYKVNFVDSDEEGIKKVSFTGPTSGITEEIRVWTPRGYDPSKGPYNVIYLLPGNPGRAGAIQTAIGVQKWVQEAIDAGTLPPTIVVSTSMNIFGQATDCADFTGRPKVESWIVNDVPNVIRANYNVSTNKDDWTITGVSAGAYCSTRLALTHPDVFGANVWFHGYNTPIDGGLANNPSVRDANKLTALVANKDREIPVRLLLIGSKEDPGTIEDANAIKAKAKPGDRIDVLPYDKGGHGWKNWYKQFPAALKWIGENSVRN
ncbi:Putative esterase [Bowdeniella nasicola]|uniref:Putative esterase n=1 Tax=Bowdeniella nasicola TaxID=208480 RepID=A0A1H4A2D7_9ACTO|nr:Putative esterase [Bowdeniella nasicola]